MKYPNSSFRTDLAVESLALSRRAQAQADKLPGVDSRERKIEGFSVTTVEIQDKIGAECLGKPVGVYETLFLDGLMRREEDSFPRACRALSELVSGLLPQVENAPILVAGLGNRQITPDAIGPRAADYVIATRHLTAHEPELFASWRPVSALAPGVLGQTGVETGEVLASLVKTIRPAAVIAVDALAAGSLSRLTRTVQVASAGIVPGSGVENARTALNRETLGVPVIAVGVPTVVDGTTLAHELARASGLEHDALRTPAHPMIVTTRDIDREAADLSRLIGYALNLALQPGLSLEDIDLYLS
ncbi:MAG: GPR endopeptidase [Butyricicoccus sp.]